MLLPAFLQGKSKRGSEAGPAVDAAGAASVQRDTASLNLTNIKEKQRGEGKTVFVPAEIKKQKLLLGVTCVEAVG